VASKVARNRLDAAKPLDVDVLASACVWAEDHLEQVARSDSALPVVDITVLAAMSAGLVDADPWLAEVGRRRQAAPGGNGGSPLAHGEQVAEEAGP
jgi:hypothetical protein